MHQIWSGYEYMVCRHMTYDEWHEIGLDAMNDKKFNVVMTAENLTQSELIKR